MLTALLRLVVFDRPPDFGELGRRRLALIEQVGHELGTTEKTIKVHRARVMEKMEADSLADLVRMAGQIGIGGPPRTV